MRQIGSAEVKNQTDLGDELITVEMLSDDLRYVFL